MRYSVKKRSNGMFAVYDSKTRRTYTGYYSRQSAESQIDHWEDMDNETDDRVLQAYGYC